MLRPKVWPSSSASGRSGRSPGNAILETLETKDVVTPSLHPNFNKKSSCDKPSAHTTGIYGVLGTLFWNDGKHHGTPACARWQWRSCRMGPGLVFFFSDFCSRGHHLNDHWFLNMDEPAGFPAGFSGFRQQPSATTISRFNYQLRLNLFGHCPWVIKPGNGIPQQLPSRIGLLLPIVTTHTGKAVVHV